MLIKTSFDFVFSYGSWGKIDEIKVEKSGGQFRGRLPALFLHMKAILIIDNFDSFTGNLFHLVADTFQCLPIIKTYSQDLEATVKNYDLCILSGGPGHPSEYPAYRKLFASTPTLPILGICLGFQIINYCFGGTVVLLDRNAHGKQESVVFQGQEFIVARYHSLGLGVIAPELKVFMSTDTGIPMGIQHRSLPVVGYQFHPESFLTEKGSTFINYARSYFNFISRRSTGKLASRA